jgi:glycosyltransferase involved in cell wall biosynthesis
MASATETCAIIVGVRDRLSCMTECLDTLIAHTPEPHELIVVAGGVSERSRNEWRRRFGEGINFIFTSHFLNQAQARNIGLRAATTHLAVVMDDDVFVRPGWLRGLLDCQRETGAVMVVPVVLETERRIHTAGNSLYITYEDGRAFGHKELRFRDKPYVQSSNLKRERVDYGELHCQLVEVEPTLRLGAFDENLLEGGEVDSALTWAKAGHSMWLEPSSVVLFRLRGPIATEDIRFFDWRWNMRSILKGYLYFEQKWGLDITEQGRFRDFLFNYNRQLGLLARLFPSRVALQTEDGLARVIGAALKPLRVPHWLLANLQAWWIGYFAWPPSSAD